MVSGLENSVIKVAAIGGSIRQASYSNGLIRAAIELSKESIVGMEVEHLDISQLPMQNIDLEGEDHGGSFHQLLKIYDRKFLNLIAFFFHLPTPLKNAIDWASRPPNVWADKAAAIISASGGMGGARGQLHLRQIGVFLDFHFINKPEFFLNAFQPPAKFDSQGNLVDENTRESLKEVLLALQAFTWRLKTATNAEINA
ncbi:hypothetical protein NC652_009489 [Populus alba x Populus x berolinensis]|nr:hypothetical protein NC652_009489 [Populus alba x Populus x berolinensis]